MFKKPSSLSSGRIQRTALALLMATGMWGSCAAEAAQDVLNVGLSPNIFPDVRPGDAIATVKVWGDEVFSAQGLIMDTHPTIYDDTVGVEKALREESVDCVAVLAEEYFDMEEYLDSERLIFYSLRGSVTKEFLLLVRRDSAIESLASLKGKTVSVADIDVRMLGWKWLETLLMEENGTSCKDHFDSISIQPKKSRAVLNLFFSNADACLTTRSTFETMTELNPQIGKTLRPILVSPEFIPSFMCLRKSYQPANVEKVYASIVATDQGEKIRQMLTVFGVESFVAGTADELETSRKWLERHAALRKQLESRKIQTAEVAK